MHFKRNQYVTQFQNILTYSVKMQVSMMKTVYDDVMPTTVNKIHGHKYTHTLHLGLTADHCSHFPTHYCVVCY